MSEDNLRLPERTVLLHIGPHKTGTTMLQGALHKARGRLLEHGVVYPGKARQHVRPAQYLNGKAHLHIPPANQHDWDNLVNEIDACREQRVVVSSEFFGEARAEAIERILEEFGRSRVHVLVTLRPLTKILPSAWQQYVRNRVRWPYTVWLKRTLNAPPHKQPTPSFWKRHHHDRLIERWAHIVGPHNLTVVMVDGADPLRLLRAVEDMLGLPAGLLEPDNYPNRSLTYGEAELIRLLNQEFRRRGWSQTFYRDVVRDAVARGLQKRRQPPEDEPMIPMPDWAAARAAQIGTQAAERISTLGVRVVGDISALGAPAHTPTGTGNDDQAEATAPQPMLYPDAAAEAVMAAVLSGRSHTDPRVSACSSRELVGVLGDRVRHRFGRTWRRPAHQLPAAALRRLRRLRRVRQLRRPA